MAEYDCESCPFVRVCDAHIEYAQNLLGILTVADAERVVQDAEARVMSEQYQEVDFGQEDTIVSQTKPLWPKGRLSLEAHANEILEYFSGAKEVVQANCIGPKTLKRYLLIGKRALACTSKHSKFAFVKEQRKLRIVS